MPNIQVHVEHWDPPTQDALRDLENPLPYGLSVGADGRTACVSYEEDRFGETQVRDQPQKHLATIVNRTVFETRYVRAPAVSCPARVRPRTPGD